MACHTSVKVPRGVGAESGAVPLFLLQIFFPCIVEGIKPTIVQLGNAGLNSNVPSTQYAVKVGDFQWVRIPPGQSIARPEATRAAENRTASLNTRQRVTHPNKPPFMIRRRRSIRSNGSLDGARWRDSQFDRCHCGLPTPPAEYGSCDGCTESRRATRLFSR